MQFPVYFHLFGRSLHPHAVMEVLAYSGGFQLYLLLRRRWSSFADSPIVPIEKNLWMIVAAIFGALIGSKTLAWAESWVDYVRFWKLTHNLVMFAGGKTIVGGLLGGWVGVEIGKKILGIRFSTGDLYVFPLIVGMSVGRVGCFLTGLADHTYGNRTSVPWAVNFGDGPRHPTQLYDIVFLLLLGIALMMRMRWPHENGRIFRLFMFCYCSYRFCVEFIKPTYRNHLGMSAIQLACLGGAAVSGWLLYGRKKTIELPMIAEAGTPGIKGQIAPPRYPRAEEGAL